MQGDFYPLLVFIQIHSVKERPDQRKERDIGLDEVHWKAWSFYSLTGHWVYSTCNSFFLFSLSSHMLPLNLKDCSVPPAALCHFTLGSLGRTQLSLLPALLAQAPWVLPGTLERLGRVAVIPISIFWKGSMPFGTCGQPHQCDISLA